LCDIVVERPQVVCHISPTATPKDEQLEPADVLAAMAGKKDNFSLRAHVPADPEITARNQNLRLPTASCGFYEKFPSITAKKLWNEATE
jgi:hypothetical protein